jgi:hypothetical protein
MRGHAIRRSVVVMFGCTSKAQLQARALDTWRGAELLVQMRWEAFLAADRAWRPRAYAAYLAALDAEAAAGGEVGHAHPDLAEAA